MYHILSKSFNFVISPLWWILALLLVYLFSKKVKVKKISGILCLSFFIFFSNQYIINKLISIWEIPLVKVKEINNFDIGIVLGGGVKTEIRDTDRVFLNASGDRLMQAVQLYKMGKIKKILYAGGAANLLGQKVPEASQVLKLLMLLSIPDTAIIIEPNSVNTFQNAKFSSQLLFQKNLASSSKLLITSSLHMRRSIAVFRNQRILCTPYSVDVASESGPHNPDYYFVPSQEALTKWTNLLHEIVGYFSYWFMGYL